MALASLSSGIKIALAVLAFLAAYQVLIRIARKVFHFPAPAFIGFFLDSGLRRWMQPPGRIIEGAGIAPGMRILEIGCGSGGYTTYTARAVGPDGEVAALDIQPGMLAQLERKLNRPENQDIRNIKLHQASAYELPFQNGELDLVYLVTVLQEIPDRDRALAEASRVLKPGGILAVSELLLDPDYVFPAATVRLVRKAGFEVQEVSGSLWTYTARFRKPAGSTA